MKQTEYFKSKFVSIYSSEKNSEIRSLSADLLPRAHQSRHLARLASYSARMSQDYIPKGVTKFVKSRLGVRTFLLMEPSNYRQILRKASWSIVLERVFVRLRDKRVLGRPDRRKGAEMDSGPPAQSECPAFQSMFKLY